ncbi:MAG: NmrA family NAD(P)-binding protein [Hyphomonadaceae bacterium]|nr:NmrA family NAD(P)-binding protein [Hyphomonadaceae bacterium]
MTRPLVAVFGAAGRQGLAQVRQLHAAGYRIRALSRRSDPFLGEAYADVEVVPADVSDDASLAAAVRGVDFVFYTHPLSAPDRPGWIGRVGKASAEAGVKRVVWNTSSWIPDRAGDPGVYAYNTHGINALWRSGAPGTVFGSVLFMDNLLTNFAFPSIARDGVFRYGQRPDLQANWISLDDVAKFMIAALDRPYMEGAWMNIGGPERLTPPEVAARLSKALGKTIPYEALTPQQFGRVLADGYGDAMSAEMKDFTAQRIGEFYVYNNTAPTRPFEVNVEAMLDRLPIDLEPFEAWARRQDWTWSNKPRPPVG